MTVNLKPTDQIATAAKKGLALVEAGRAGDGLQEQTLQDARRMAARKALSVDKVRAMPAWFARHETDRKSEWDKAGEETPGYVAWLLWGGETAAGWASRKVAQLDKQNKKSLEEVGNMADVEQVMPEPGEGTAEDLVVDRADCIEELIEALADTVVFKARAHGAHWNVKGPAFGAYHELFRAVYADADEAIDPLAEQLLKLDVDAPSTLNDFAARSTITPADLNSDDPQVLALDLRDMNEQVLESLEGAFDCATEIDEQGLANFLAERIDAHKKNRWQLTRSISNSAEAPVVAPANPPEDTEVEEEDQGMEETPAARGLRLISESDLRDQPALAVELRNGADVIEQRLAPSKVEVRALENGTWQLEGMAAVFDSPSADLGGFTEVLKRGAFKTVLADPNLDVRALFNHSADKVLGRTTNGTLQLEETPRGLRYTVTVPDVSYARDLRVLLERGDVTQSSFAFRMLPAGKGQEWADSEDGTLVRTITEIGGLLDVSPVTYPAYSAATAGVRSESSTPSMERNAPADAAEQGESAIEETRRREAEQARRERQLRLRERQLKKTLNK
jgi:HK97 family phage prohead protease